MERTLLREGLRCLGASRPDPVEDGVDWAGGTALRQDRSLAWMWSNHGHSTRLSSGEWPPPEPRRADEAFLLPAAAVPSSPS